MYCLKLFLLISFPLLVSCNAKQNSAPENNDVNVLKGSVTRVLDGDTLQIADDRLGVQTIRLLGIDAPEKGQRFGSQATSFLKVKTIGKQIRVEYESKDRYQRILGKVFVGDEWINKELVGNGLAWHYVKYSDDIELQKAQNNARRRSLGIWSDARRIAPWDYRDGVRRETSLPVNKDTPKEDDRTVYITSTGEKYHRKSCRYCNGSCTPIPLSRAISAYSACKVCKP